MGSPEKSVNAPAADKSILGSMPDPMRPYFVDVVFVMLLITVMYAYLRLIIFKPLSALMEQRAREIAEGQTTQESVQKKIEAQQQDYQQRLQALRAQAFQHKKQLTTAAQDERALLMGRAKTEAQDFKTKALQTIQKESDQARKSLESDVDSLADMMVKQLLADGSTR